MVEPANSKPAAARRRRIWRLMPWALGAAVLLVAGGYHCFLRLPVGRGPAGPSVPGEPFGKPWRHGKVLLLGIGDSMTAGFGARRRYSYFDRLVQNPPEEAADMKGKALSAVFPNLTARNMAESGTTSLHHVGKQIPRLETQPSDVFGIVVMSSGGNDIIHDYGRRPPVEGAMYGATMAQAAPWIANYEKRLDAMLLMLKARFPGGCHVFLANIYDPTDGTGNPGFTGLPAWPDGLSVLKAYNEAIARCAAKHDFVHLVNVHDLFLGHGLHCCKFWLKHYCASDPHYWYSIVEDPNERGYDALRRLFLIEMARVLAPATAVTP
ncbi:MAG: SGNH/GDSL hydrolase family protein [Planctomycetes bacterium]|nr:SGNH/GDSL hydrolase family protein [Planctomycetota bacterium]